MIAMNYNAKTFRKEKVKNKTALQEELGLEVRSEGYDAWCRIPSDRSERL